MNSAKVKKIINDYAVVIMLVLLVAVFTAINPRFVSFDNIMTIFRQAAVIGLMGVGLCFCFLVGGFDLSNGSVVSMTSLLAAKLMSSNESFGLDIVPALFVALLVALLVGFINGLMITKTGMPPLIGTLSTQTIVSGLSLLMVGGKSVYGLPEKIKFIGQGFVGPIPVPVILMVVVMLIASFVLNKTYYGRYVYAVGSNAEVARLSGINTQFVKISAYMISSFGAFLAGVVLLSRLNSGQVEVGAQYPMLVVTACVAGGVSISGGQGAMFKAFIGIILISCLSNGFTLLRISDYWQSVVQGLILAFAVGFDSYQKLPRLAKRVRKGDTAAGKV